LDSESALYLLQDVSRDTTPGGVWTTGSAGGLALVRRLQARVGRFPNGLHDGRTAAVIPM